MRLSAAVSTVLGSGSWFCSLVESCRAGSDRCRGRPLGPLPPSSGRARSLRNSVAGLPPSRTAFSRCLIQCVSRVIHTVRRLLGAHRTSGTNFASWSSATPLRPIVLFFGLPLAGLVAFSRMDVTTSRTSISRPCWSRSRSPAPRRPRSRPRSRRRSRPRSAPVNGVDEINSTVTEGNSNTFVQFEIGTPIDRAVEDVRNADPPDPRRPARRHPRAAGRPRRHRRTSRSAYSAPRPTDMTIEQLSWYIDNTVAKQLLAVPGMAAVNRIGGVDREIRVMLDPATLQAQGSPPPGQPAAAPGQHQRRRRPRRDRRLRAVGPRARQRRERL